MSVAFIYERYLFICNKNTDYIHIFMALFFLQKCLLLPGILELLNQLGNSQLVVLSSSRWQCEISKMNPLHLIFICDTVPESTAQKILSLRLNLADRFNQMWQGFTE